MNAKTKRDRSSKKRRKTTSTNELTENTNEDSMKSILIII
jgi:hypothetical protein